MIVFGANFISNIGEEVAMLLFGIGFANLLFQRNLIRKIIGLNIMDSSIYLFLAEKGYISGRLAPIVVNGIQDVDAYINPIPSGLVLTGIVVSVSVTALMLSLTVRLYKRYHTLDLDEISARLKKEGLSWLLYRMCLSSLLFCPCFQELSVLFSRKNRQNG